MNIKIKAALYMVALLGALAGIGLLIFGFMYAGKTFWFGTIIVYTVGCIYLAFMLYMLYSMILIGIEIDERRKKHNKLFPGPFTPEDEKKWRKSILEKK